MKYKMKAKYVPLESFMHSSQLEGECLIQFQKQQQRKPHNFPMRPKPLSVTFRGDRVIVVFKKEDYMKLRPIVNQRIMWRERPRGRVQQMLIDKMEH